MLVVSEGGNAICGRYTYGPLHGVYNERSCTANANAPEKHGSSFILVSSSSNAESARSCCLLRLGQKGLRVGNGTVVKAVGLEAGLDHVFGHLVSTEQLEASPHGDISPRGKMDTHVATPARPPQRRTDRAS